MTDIRPDIERLRDAALRQADDLHDDFVRFVRLYHDVQVRSRYGPSALVVRNARTGSVTETAEQWVDRARESTTRFRVRTFRDLSAGVELFVDPLLRLWFGRFPHMVDGKSVPLSDILPATDLRELKARATAAAINATLNDKLKGRPAAWFKYLKQTVGCTVLAADVDRFAERKAARDALEHHNGVIDPAYLDKAGSAARMQAGDLFEPDDTAIDDLHGLVKDLIGRIAADAITHFPIAAAAETA